MKLSETVCKNAKPNGKSQKLADGEGGIWKKACLAMKCRFHGKEKHLAFGNYSNVSLVEVKEKYRLAKKELDAGRNPSDHLMDSDNLNLLITF